MRAAAGSRGGHAVVVTLAAEPVTHAKLISFDYAVVTAVFPFNMPAQGGERIDLFGVEFGFSDVTAVARIGHTTCMSSRWISQSAISCKVPAGSAVEQAPVRLSIYPSPAAAVASPFSTFTYNTAPVLKSVHPDHAPTAGGVEVTVTGERMALSPSTQLQFWRRGPDGIRPFLKLCPSNHEPDPLCQPALIGEAREGRETNITFTIPPGVGEDYMLVYLDESAGLPVFEEWSPTFSYSAPAVHSIVGNGRSYQVTPLSLSLSFCLYVSLSLSLSLSLSMTLTHRRLNVLLLPYQVTTKAEAGGAGAGSIHIVASPLLFAASGGTRDITVRGSSFGGDAGTVRVLIGEGGGVGVSGGGGVVVEGLRAAGVHGHSTLVCTLPEIDLGAVEGGVLAMQSLRVELDGRTSPPVIDAVSILQTSLPLQLTLDTSYDSIRAHEAALDTFQSSFRASLIALVLGVEVTILPSGLVSGVRYGYQKIHVKVPCDTQKRPTNRCIPQPSAAATSAHPEYFARIHQGCVCGAGQP